MIFFFFSIQVFSCFHTASFGLPMSLKHTQTIYYVKDIMVFIAFLFYFQTSRHIDSQRLWDRFFFSKKKKKKRG